MNRKAPAFFAVLLAGGIVGRAAPASSADSQWPIGSRQTAETRLAADRSRGGPGDMSASGRSANGLASRGFGEVPSFSLAGLAAPASGSPSSRPALTTPSGPEGAVAAAEAKTIERGPLPTLRASVLRDIREVPEVLWRDSKAAFGNPWNLALLLSMGGGSFALRASGADNHVDDHYRDHPAFNGDWPDTFGALGNPGLHFALAGAWYLAGQELQHDKTYEVGRKMFSALAITGVSTMFLKVCAWDYSPNGEWGAWPSGHVSSTMALATVLNDAYGPLVGVPMYGLTTLVAIERMDDREHWLSDVAFGAVLGWVVAETVMKEHRPEIFGGEVVPYVDPAGGAGIGWLKNLGVEPVKH